MARGGSGWLGGLTPPGAAQKVFFRLDHRHRAFDAVPVLIDGATDNPRIRGVHDLPAGMLGVSNGELAGLSIVPE